MYPFHLPDPALDPYSTPNRRVQEQAVWECVGLLLSHWSPSAREACCKGQTPPGLCNLDPRPAILQAHTDTSIPPKAHR